MNEWPFGNLNPMSYDLILADPATRFETWSAAGESKSPQAQYDTMTWDELAELKVHRLARGDAFPEDASPAGIWRFSVLFRALPVAHNGTKSRPFSGIRFRCDLQPLSMQIGGAA